jgi:hypothetical protein
MKDSDSVPDEGATPSYTVANRDATLRTLHQTLNNDDECNFVARQTQAEHPVMVHNQHKYAVCFPWIRLRRLRLDYDARGNRARRRDKPATAVDSG